MLSSLLHRFGEALFIVGNKAVWWIGEGSKIDFWHDNWLGSPLVDKLPIPWPVARNLKAAVSNFITADQWCLPPSFTAAFPEITRQVEAIVLSGGDSLPHMDPSYNGIISLGRVYDYGKSLGEDCQRFLCVFKLFIPARRPLLASRILKNKLPTDANLRRCGLIVSSFCSLCMNAHEHVQQLFFECPYVSGV